MAVELGEVFPGGFASDADGVPPHRFAATDLFPNDPDHSLETLDSVASATELMRRIIEAYVLPATQIALPAGAIEPPLHPAPVSSLKFRGEESVRAIIKDLALRAQASWGVDAFGQFYFYQPRSALLAVWREGADLTRLSETRDREHLFNRVLLTGDYIYDEPDSSANIARRSYRWRGNYTQPDSRAAFGDRRIRLWVPWLRTETDSVSFVREFFRTYSQPTSRYLLETTSQQTLPLPWLGQVRVEDRDGEELITAAIETIRVQFDHAPTFRLELGPEDPRELWPEPPHDERWELPQGRSPGGGISLTDLPPLSGYPTSTELTSSDITSSDITSSNLTSSLLMSSELSSGLSLDVTDDSHDSGGSSDWAWSSDTSSGSTGESGTGDPPSSSQVSSTSDDLTSSTAMEATSLATSETDWIDSLDSIPTSASLDPLTSTALSSDTSSADLTSTDDNGASMSQ
ncbi:MAG: hypothetical protein R3B90_05620 [Planctomycetaceae bacterium]